MEILHPARGWVLVKVLEEEKKTKQGIYLTDTLHDEPMLGEVLEIGRPIVREGGLVSEAPDFDILDKDKKPLRRRKLEIGDIVIFKAHTDHQLPSYEVGEKIAFVNFDSILGAKFPEEEQEKK